MAWLSRNNFSPSDYLDANDLNNLANDDRNWSGDVNGGGHTLSNVIIAGSVTAGMPDPTTTLGDLIVRGPGAPPTRLGVGSNGQVLTADSTQTLGVAWKTPVAASPVASVFGRTGAIVATKDDYSVSQITGALADPTSTKGDLLARGASQINRLGVGADGLVLTADSANALGVSWKPAAGGVATVFGRSGAVIAKTDDYTAAQVTGAVPNTVQVVAGAGMSGGGPLSANVTLNALVTSVFGRTGAVALTAADISTGGGVPATRQVLPGAGMTGGGNLGADITLSAAVTSVFGRTGPVALTAADLTGAGGVLSSRQIIAGTGLTGGGDLSADRTLSVVPGSVNQLVAVAYAGTVKGTRPTVNFISGGGVSITVADDPATSSVDVTLGVTSSAVGVAVGGVAKGTRPTINFIPGSNVLISGADNSTGNSVDVTISASISGSAGAQTPWVTNIDAASFQLANVSYIGVNRPADSPNAHISINSTSTDGLKISNSSASGLAQATLQNSDSSAKLILIASGPTAAANPSTAQINTAGPLLLVTNGVEAMRISAAQRVLVGTKTDDGTNLLQVNGKIKSLSGGIVFPDSTIQTTAAVSGFADPTTTKGDLIAHGTTTTRLPVGADGLVLTADSTQTLGVGWKAAVGGVSSFNTRTGAVVPAKDDYTVAQVSGAVPNTTQVIAGTGLTGGGSLSGNVTLNANVSGIQTPWLGDIDASSHFLNNVFAIGIGTAASSSYPLYILRNVAGAAYCPYAQNTNSAGWSGALYANNLANALAIGCFSTDYSFGFVANTAFIQAYGGIDLAFITGAEQAERMRIASAGNVGIGTPTPGYMLDVYGPTASAAAAIHLSSDGSDNGAYFQTYTGGRALVVAGATLTSAAQWIPKQSSAMGMHMIPGNAVNFFASAALTAGVAFTPTVVFQILAAGGLGAPLLPGSNPGAGSKQFWYDPSDGNRVKFAA
ncbi:MAG TPA: hypothetical protein VGF16_16805 [Bryobacteraceae bacterium]|jgi:hypothetical protein